jgi:hypothetical protein
LASALGHWARILRADDPEAYVDPESTEHVHDLPIYQLGFADDRDVGLRIGLDAITHERIRQTQLQATHDTASPAAARHEYAAARLVDVAKVIGARFRQ